jgi:hypothetical protein
MGPRQPCRHRVVAWIVLALVPAARPALAQTPAATRPSVTRPVPFDVDLEESRVYVKVTSSGSFGHPHGVEGRLASGKVELGRGGELVLDMRSFAVDTPEARRHVALKGGVSSSEQQKITDTKLGKDVLDAVGYPGAVYKIASCTPVDGQAAGNPGRYQLEGELTLHGVTRRLSSMAAFERSRAPGVFRLRGSFPIQQSQFGIQPYSALGGLVGVADRLEIWGDLVLRSPTPNAHTATVAP